jgi:hypothetical protein
MFIETALFTRGGESLFILLVVRLPVTSIFDTPSNPAGQTGEAGDVAAHRDRYPVRFVESGIASSVARDSAASGGRRVETPEQRLRIERVRDGGRRTFRDQETILPPSPAPLSRRRNARDSGSPLMS